MRRIEPVIGVALLLLLIATYSSPSAPGRTSGSSEALAPSPLVCEVSCSPTKPRTPVAELSWLAMPTKLAGAEQLEVTVYKDGFERRAFARVASLAPQNRFSVIESKNQVSLPEMSVVHLVVTDVRREKAKKGAPARTIVRVEGLEPGLNYYWRLDLGEQANKPHGAITSCQAPVCPADYVDDPNARP